MSTAYPGALDNFQNPLPGDSRNNPSHAAQHTNANDAIEAIQAYLGVSTSTDPATITGRVAALEAGGGSVAWDSITGTPTTIADYGITDAYTIAQVQALYLPLVGGTLTGPLNFTDSATGGSASIDVTLDPLSSIGAATVVNSPEGQVISSPYIVMNTPNLQTTMPGAAVGSLISVTSIDSFGVVSLGYVNPPAETFSQSDTNNVDVVIKATNVAPAPTTWVSLGLTITLTEDILANTGNLSFEMILSNPTTRTGVVEFGLQKNGVAFPDVLVFQIPANYLQTTSASVPLQEAYAAGDVLNLVARVTSNSNNQFSLLMDNTPNLGAMTVWAIGASTGGGGGAVNSVGATAPVTSTGGTNPVIAMPKATASVDGYLDNADFATFAAKANADASNASAPWPVALGVDDLNSTNTLKQWVGTQAQYDALGTWDANTFYNITDATTEADSVVDQGAGASLKFWYGTEAQYTAIATKDPATLYFRSA